MKNLTFLLVLLVATVFKVDAELKVGDKICTEGFVMDYFCIQQGVLMNDPNIETLVGPESHSFHCLIDMCESSTWEILLDPTGDSNLYTRGFQLNDGSHDQAVALGRSVGVCNTCDEENMNTDAPDIGFRVAMTATIESLNEDSDFPPTIDVEVMVDATGFNSAENDGQSACLALLGIEKTEFAISSSEPAEAAAPTTHLFFAYASLILVAWTL